MITQFRFNDIVLFGKYRDWAIEDVIEEDPSYVSWCKRNIRSFTLDPKLEVLLADALEKDIIYPLGEDDCGEGDYGYYDY